MGILTCNNYSHDVVCLLGVVSHRTCRACRWSSCSRVKESFCAGLYKYVLPIFVVILVHTGTEECWNCSKNKGYSTWIAAWKHIASRVWCLFYELIALCTTGNWTLLLVYNWQKLTVNTLQLTVTGACAMCNWCRIGRNRMGVTVYVPCWSTQV